MSPKNFVFELFGRSPVRPLQAHMDKVRSCIAELPLFIQAVDREDWDTARTHQERIVELEHDADRLKKDLRLHLPKGLMLAMSRRDVLDTLLIQDQIANKAKDIAGLMLGRQMRFPDDMQEPVQRFLQRSVDTVDQAGRAVNELDELVEAGFRGHEVEVVNRILQKLDSLEHEADDAQREVREMLFARETELPPVNVMFMYRVIDSIGDLADLAQRVGSRLQLMLAK
ncbi:MULTISPECIES: TIGR00153 family protein [unclassified Thioalkalivibrio]|uniref:TIGR00153 family protein n=1 Tax=unclassified Thioalkalivibrio TaxID=2621013 RepID=UPI000382BB37|nr:MULTISPECIES: TIGR00153 family protein [unclassified Thioalkalivibrio]